MFDWFWEFLYMISKTLFRLTDGLILCANKLCGIEPVSFNGEDTDLMSYLIFSDEIGFAFKATALLATILVVIFTVFMIIRSITRDKAEGTPTQLAVKAFKTVLTFFFVPAVILAFVLVGNLFVTAIYNATIQASSTPGTFLFCAFAEDGGMPDELVEKFRTGIYDYINEDEVWACMDLSDFPFLFSWIAGGVVLFSIGSSMLIFVDRVLSLVILYIVSPISISSSVLDDGARFKLWRDQFLSKFIMGYGMIIAVNIYALVCTLVMDPDFAFFEDSGFLNLLMKLLMIAGGALTMQKSMALIGNLVSAGAGSNELRDNAFTAGKLASMAGGVLGNTVGLLPKLAFKGGKSILSDAWAMKSRDWGAQLLDKVGLGLTGGTSDKNGVKDPPGKSGAKNDDKAKYGSNPNAAKDAISGNKGFQTSDWGNQGKDNTNNDSPKQSGNNMLNNAIQGGGDKK
jgi:hypothetical protein